MVEPASLVSAPQGPSWDHKQAQTAIHSGSNIITYLPLWCSLDMHFVPRQSANQASQEIDARSLHSRGGSQNLPSAVTVAPP